MYKKLPVLLAVFVAALAFCALPAMAEMKNFTSVKVDVPAGWTAGEISTDAGPAVALASPDGKGKVDVTVGKTGGASTDRLAAEIAKKLGAAEKPDTFSTLPDSYSFPFTNSADNTQSTAIVSARGDNYLLIVLTGDSPSFGTIIETVDIK